MAYSAEALTSAIAEAKEDRSKSVRAVARKYGIPSSTLHDHVSGKAEKTGAGGVTVLTASEEREIAVTCMVLGDMGFGLTRDLVEVILHQYLQKNGIPNPFTGGVPGKDWWQRFLKRWPCLSERKPQHLSKKRAQASYPEVINGWFDKVEEALREAALDPADPSTACRFWNCDETGFCTTVSSRSLLVRRGTKQVSEISRGSGHEYITVQSAGCASGERLPPFILYKGKNLYQRWMEGGPAGALYGVTESGWMDPANFCSWFTKLFIPAVSHLTATGAVFLFFDGHYSHISLELIQRAKEHNIHLLCLPPNTTHLLQPLDVGVFAPLKKGWRKVLKRYQLETAGGKATKETFPGLLAQLWECFKPDYCKAGFRSTGLFPLSREHVLTKLPPSVPTSSTLPPPSTPPQPLDDRDPMKSLKCGKCGSDIPATPLVKTRLTTYFAGMLEVRMERPKIGKRNNMKIRVEGEAITTEEFLKLLEEEQKEKSKGKKKGKKTRESSEEAAVDENTCSSCGGQWDDDDEEEQRGWIGCDNDSCGRWYHYWCAGFSRMPSSRKKFICISCSK